MSVARIRRLTTALLLATAVAGGLAACQVQPGAAGFVGTDRITQAQVDDVFDSISSKIKTSEYGGWRQTLARELVMRDLIVRTAHDRGITLSTVDYGSYVQAKLPTSNPYIRLSAETDTWLSDLGRNVDPVTPTERQYRQIYTSLVAMGYTQTYGQLRDAIAGLPGLDRAAGLQQMLNESAARYHVQLNPRYGEAVFPLALHDANGTPAGYLPVKLGASSQTLVVSATPTLSAG